VMLLSRTWCWSTDNVGWRKQDRSCCSAVREGDGCSGGGIIQRTASRAGTIVWSGTWPSMVVMFLWRVSDGLWSVVEVGG
jgi:hypothetical protein